MPVSGIAPAAPARGEGSFAAAVAGSGMAMPTGIESMIEYNGLLLNVKDWIDTYIVTSIAGLDDAAVRDAATENPDDHGETPGTALYGGRPLTIEGYIRASQLEKLRDMQAAFNDLKTHQLIFRNSNPARDYYLDVRKAGSLSMADAQTDQKMQRSFMIALKAYNPRILALYQSAVNVAVTSGYVALPVQGGGDFPAQPIIEIYGGVRDITITNDVNGGSIGIEGLIPDGDKFRLDVKRRTLTDMAGVNQFDRLTDSSTSMLIEPSFQTLSITSSYQNPALAAVSVQWNNTVM
jgi:phage-related protein